MARIWQSAFSIDFELLGGFENSLKRDIKKVPQIGLEPTTLRLTGRFHVVARNCGLVLIHSSFAFPDFVALLT